MQLASIAGWIKSPVEIKVGQNQLRVQGPNLDLDLEPITLPGRDQGGVKRIRV